MGYSPFRYKPDFKPNQPSGLMQRRFHARLDAEYAERMWAPGYSRIRLRQSRGLGYFFPGSGEK